jgi:hypothetical protein
VAELTKRQCTFCAACHHFEHSSFVVNITPEGCLMPNPRQSILHLLIIFPIRSFTG